MHRLLKEVRREHSLPERVPRTLGGPAYSDPAERGTAVGRVGGMEELYRLEVVERLQGQEFPGNLATANGPVSLRDVVFQNPLPSLVLQRGASRRFVLTGFHNTFGQSPGGDRGVYLESEEEFGSRTPGVFLRANAGRAADLSPYGLTTGPQIDDQLWLLYHSILDSLAPAGSHWQVPITQ